VVKLPRLEDSIYEVVRLNGRIAGALGRVAVEFLRDVTTTLNESPLLDLDGGRRDRRPRQAPYDAEPTRLARPQAAWAPPPPPPQPAPPPQSVMLLEAEAGTVAVGFFVVENTLTHEVLVRVLASEFFEPAATTSRPRLTFYPEPVMLAPGEQIAMRALAAIDDTLEPGTRYRCRLTMPALPGTAIPVVIRRRPDQAAAASSAAARETEARSLQVGPTQEADDE
jgi:hypothetical protein